MALRLSPEIHALLILLSVSLASLTSYLFFRRARIYVSKRLFVAAVAVKTVIILLLLFCALSPFYATDVIVEEKMVVPVLIDNSFSMGIRDCDDGRSRIENILNKYLRKIPVILKRNFIFRFYEFSSGIKEVNQNKLHEKDGISHNGALTDIGRAITDVCSEHEGQRIAGIIMFSDGNDNSDDLSVLSVNPSVPVFPVVAGGEKSISDVSITRVIYDGVGIMGDKAEIKVSVRAHGYGNSVIYLTLSENGKILESRKIKTAGSEFSAEETIYASLTRKGRNKFVISVDQNNEDAVKDNNQRTVYVDALNRKPSILMVAGSPSWEIKFLNRFLGSSGDFNADVFVFDKNGEFYRLPSAGKPFPKERNQILNYDVVVLANVNADKLTRSFMDAVVELVEKKSGGFLMTGGENSFGLGGYANTPLKKILPVEITGRDNGMEIGPFSVDINPEEAGNPVLRFAETAEESIKAIREIPELDAHNNVIGVKPGSTTLIRGNKTAKYGKPVILATGKYGAGRTAVFTPIGSWRWDFAVKGTESRRDIYEKLWTNLFRYLSVKEKTEDGRGITFELEKDIYEYGENVKFKIRKAPAEGGPLSVIAESKSAKKEISVARNRVTGIIEGEFIPDNYGEHKLSVKYGTRFPLIETKEFCVNFPDRELTVIPPNADLLGKISSKSGGRIIRSMDELENAFRNRTGRLKIRTEISLWDYVIIFLLVIIFLSVDWLIKRIKGFR